MDVTAEVVWEKEDKIKFSLATWQWENRWKLMRANLYEHVDLSNEVLKIF